MSNMNTISKASDFLFLFEAINCNPNGDPDQENKPRMDYETKRNLVTDTRIKRYIRDYLKHTNEEEVVFVDMEGNNKVSVDTKLREVVKRTIAEPEELALAFADNEKSLESYQKLLKDNNNDPAEVWKKVTDDKFKEKQINYELLAYLIKQKFTDVRMFGSAFAVKGFTKAYTGPIQMNWGYSLNKVELIDSNSIVTIMNDDSSTFGKDYRLYYSLLAFNGTINPYTAKSTGLKEEDVEAFRNALWESIPATPSRSKLNQYPKLYIEIIYKEGSNGQFGDLRNYVSVEPVDNLEENKVRSFADLTLNTHKLEQLIEEHENKIERVVLRTSPDVTVQIPESLLNENS